MMRVPMRQSDHFTLAKNNQVASLVIHYFQQGYQIPIDTYTTTEISSVIE